MKSIIEQASSIIKAIEKAWDQADKPNEFSIKIFEKEEKNFFGMTSKPAKIGIFFADKPIIQDKPAAKPRQEIKECRPARVTPQVPQKKTTPQRPTTVPTDNRSSNPAPTERPRPLPATWSDVMIGTTETWLKKTLSLMGMNSVNFTKEIAGKNLKLTFSAPLIADVMHEKQLFRSFAHLIMSSLRNQYKQEIKDLKVILIRPE